MRSIDDALDITLNDNGRILRNLIHGADTIMSHITHFYHLAAADFVNISPAQGVLGSPWDDGKGGNAFGTTSDCQFVSLTAINALTTTGRLTGELVESYVMALNMRKTAHTMGAIFSGRQPISNAIVPGGVSTLFTQSDIDNFRTKLNSIRNFINVYYIPDVLFVATRTNVNGEDWTKYWNVGTNPGLLLSYGEYPETNEPFRRITNPNAMLLSRGLVTYPTGTLSFNSASIAEYVDYSFYTYATAGPRHPSNGETTPLQGEDLDKAIKNGPQYSWLKAPRYNGQPAEVGPLARVLVSYLFNNPHTVTEAGSTPLGNVIPALSLPSQYSITNLVSAVLTYAGLNVGNLWSPLGRHAARALECKFVADAMYSWLDDLALNEGITNTTNYTTAVATGSGYVYKKIPKGTFKGTGLCEAPRGALGHWITIMDKKIASYQCVVPTTWNNSPKDGNGVHGPAESALIGIPAGANVNDAIVNIARMLHPYDFCIACAVHVVSPDGKEIAKFEMGTDGKIKRL